MTVRFYSTKESLLAAGGTETSSPNGHAHWIDLGSVRFNADDSNPFTSADEHGEVARFPQVDRGLIHHISVRETLYLAHRRVGQYSLWTATASVRLTTMPSLREGLTHYEIQCVGPNWEDIQALCRQVIAGSIWPDSDGEGGQVPPPCRHLQQLAREACGIIRREAWKTINGWRMKKKKAKEAITDLREQMKQT